MAVVKSICTIIFAAFAAVCLSGCSYVFKLKPEFRGGELWFEAADTSFFDPYPTCLESIDVTEQNSGNVVWSAQSPTGACSLELPFKYGASFPDQQETPQQVATPLKAGEIYDVSAESDRSGYGGVRFTIEDGEVRILSY